VKAPRYPWGMLAFLLVLSGGLVARVVAAVASGPTGRWRALALVGGCAVFIGCLVAWRSRQLLRGHRAVVQLRPGWDVRTAVSDESLLDALDRLSAHKTSLPRRDYAVSVALGPDRVELWRGEEPTLLLSLPANRIEQVIVTTARVSLLPSPALVLGISGVLMVFLVLVPARHEGSVWAARRSDVEKWAVMFRTRYLEPGMNTVAGGKGE